MKYKQQGNCPYCDSERGITTYWGMSLEGFASLRESHNQGHPENQPPKPIQNQCCCTKCPRDCQICVACHQPPNSTQKPQQTTQEDGIGKLDWILKNCPDIFRLSYSIQKLIHQLLSQQRKELDQARRIVVQAELMEQKAQIRKRVENMKKQPDCSENDKRECTPTCGYNKALADLLKEL